jgi:transcriptional regulator with XRE-family HTH domain
MAKQEPTPGTLAQRLQTLRENIRTESGQPYTYAAIAAHVQKFTGDMYSPTREYISSLVNGKKDNPSMEILAGLADFFEVSPAYFFDDAKSESIQRDLELYGLLRERVTSLQMRALINLDEAGLEQIRQLLRDLPEDRG